MGDDCDYASIVGVFWFKTLNVNVLAATHVSRIQGQPSTRNHSELARLALAGHLGLCILKTQQP